MSSPEISWSLMDQWPLYSLFLTITYQVGFFIVTYAYRFDKVTDLAGTSNFAFLAIVGLLFGGSFYERQVVLAMLVCVWALRLGSFLFLRVLLRKRDSRFDKMRDSLPKLAGFWSLQAVWVWIGSLPMMFINMSRVVEVPITLMDHIGWAMWTAGFLCESIADLQRHRFTQRINDPRARPFLDTGLWRWSRHPNYCGEILLWLGIAMSAANGLWGAHPWQALLAFCSPLLSFVLLVFVSGIPLAEAKEDRRNHRLMAYKQYKFCTSPLILLPRSWYSQVPIWAKKWFFFDFYQLAFITPHLSRSLDSASRQSRMRRSTSRSARPT